MLFFTNNIVEISFQNITQCLRWKFYKIFWLIPVCDAESTGVRKVLTICCARMSIFLVWQEMLSLQPHYSHNILLAVLQADKRSCIFVKLLRRLSASQKRNTAKVISANRYQNDAVGGWNVFTQNIRICPIEHSTSVAERLKGDALKIDCSSKIR